ncbi:hypothetical protein T484DRAFT_1756140 [Baffinella frigidus]|nr:hypothetical protein T484DRAFT_1756140 [Cryptophyta sp. CCMP2293]
MGHCIATLCGSVFDPDECDDIAGLLPDGDKNGSSAGVNSTKRIDAVLTQGSDGAHAMDKLMRDCLQCEPGARLHICVAYTLLRMQVMRGSITQKERVFMPDHMILYVEPSGAPVGPIQPEMSRAFMRVRVFRFLVIPSGISRASAKRKAGNESTDSDDDAEMTSGLNPSHTAHTNKTLPHTNKTLRNRLR